MIFSKISIIIPTWNNTSIIPNLVEKVDEVMKSQNFNYEIIFVDDRSTDHTKKIILDKASRYPITGLYLKEGQSGRDESILEGLAYANFNLILVLDPKLEDAVNLLPELIYKINHDRFDLAVLNLRPTISFLRKFFESVFHLLFYKWLLGIEQNTQSEVLVFKKEIADRIVFKSRNFVLELLLKARSAGYKIFELNSDLPSSRLKSFKLQISEIISGIKLKFQHSSIIPFNKKQVKKKGYGFHINGVEFINHTDLDLDQSALFRLTNPQITVLLFLFAVLALAFFLNWFVTLQIFVAVLTFFYFTDLLFNLFLILRSFIAPAEIKISQDEIDSFDNSGFEWPTYTIFCPLYKEAEVLPQFAAAMSRIDYPKEHLQIMLLLEEDDTETQKKAKELNLPSYFETVIVPNSLPKTKPKACNYGLSKARGEFIVIYDAEDVPEQTQLKKAIIAFEHLGPKTICIQAKLNFYNPKQNLLTRVFTAEYSLWFDLVLTGLQSIQGPIPLGGTSNHFRAEHLHIIEGWDAFNVTEDCDLGIRLVKQGYKTAIVDSTTLEEANSSFPNWFRQRSRWIKGYIQTYFVHMRKPQELFKNWREPHILTFQLVVGGKVMSLFINPILWIITIVYFWQRAVVAPYVEPLFPPLVYYLAVVSLIFGNFFYLYYYMIGCAKRGYDDLLKYVFFVPLYWLTMSAAAWKAVYEIFRKPHFWQKTVHGLHLGNKNSAAELEPELVSQKP
jgi:cellulose synthase/poly-beta-1,6-N-acetylglucosamine synthase-like glycosyltransferase